jgi:hypothetical protein
MFRTAAVLILPVFIFLLSACQSLPGQDSSIHYFKVQHNGQATLTRIYQLNGKTVLDFNWQADNNSGQATAISHIAIDSIAGLKPTQELTSGQTVPLQVLHFFQQRGSTKPELLRSVWSVDAEILNPLVIKRAYRPPRCPNQ